MLSTTRRHFVSRLGAFSAAAAGFLTTEARAQTGAQPRTAPAAPGEAPAAPSAPESETAKGDVLHPPPKIEWEKIAELPPAPGFDHQPGLAGVFAGAHENALIIAGGTSYPGGGPWTGAKRAWWSNIYVLQRTLGPENRYTYQWFPGGAELPRNLAYGASVSLPEGVLCIGGTEFNSLSKRCFVLKWVEAVQRVVMIDFPDLPRPLAHCAAVKLGDFVYVLGGQEKMPRGRGTTTFLALDLRQRDTPGFGWKELPPWDGPGRIAPIAAPSLEGEVAGLYLCGGRDPNGSPDFLTDLHRFVPGKGWAILGNIAASDSHPASLMAAPAFHVPPDHLVIVGGSDEELIRLLEKYDREIELRGEAWAARLRKFTDELMQTHPGYSPRMLAYDAASGEWTDLGDFPGEACLSTPTVNWDGAMIIPGGETAPGRRSPAIWQATIRKKAAVIE